MDKSENKLVLVAAPYRDFNGWMREGKVHLIRDNPFGHHLTLCGKTLTTCPGKIKPGVFGDVTCKVCLSSQQSHEHWAERQLQWKREQAVRDAEREEKSRQWWEAYDKYIESARWQEKRRLVYFRCKGMCEGCGTRRVEQIHHLSYPKNCLAGSDEWDKREKLFTLVGVCSSCHDDLHPV